METARQLGLIVKAGWVPSYVIGDVLHSWQTKRGIVPIVADIEYHHFRELHMSRGEPQPKFVGEVAFTKDGKKFPLALNPIHEFFLSIKNAALREQAIKECYAQLPNRKRKAFLHQLDPENAGKQGHGLDKAIQHYVGYVEPATHLAMRSSSRFLAALNASE